MSAAHPITGLGPRRSDSTAEREVRVLRRALAQAEASLEAAAALQRSWLPADEPFRRARLDIAGHCRAAALCSGDWWTIRPLEDDHVLLLIGDVTGHGADSALMTAVARGAVDLITRILHPRPVDCGDVLRALNLAICDAGRSDLLMTCSVAVIDGARGVMTAASAGHPMPYLLRASGAIEAVPVKGPALGVALSSRYPRVRVELDAGDAVLWFTDGLLECQDRRGRQLGPRRLRQLVSAAGTRDPAALRDALCAGVAQFTEGAPAVDDLAFAIARFG